MKIQESGEMYLEAILVLKEKGLANIRAIDIANQTGYSKPSVSRALHLLENNGYIVINENGFIHFTDVGFEHAQTIYERHRVLTRLFLSIGVCEETAEEDACKIEHVISDETFNALKKKFDLI
ncbi:MAG: metal-dependent transcriptional regulator [Oscillospiraceae bacterium]|nr:metal-dependent transcriptional regulator [Oscillospiraceae bacterium]